ncbi:fimbria/pilus periplasmic chaperone [Serratia ureilytica]|uniref:fimbria/pilus periplasmic chaperone n=1 Tax=Serratia ureilytica TaxID=300181 RepID=UPI0034C64FD1
MIISNNIKNIPVSFARFLLTVLITGTLCLYTPVSIAGVALGATRVIYPSDNKQVQLAVTNNDENTFLIQSWIENSAGEKDASFVITPPLFAMQGKKENTLRIIDATQNKLPQDRESLFWINVKSIPSSKKDSGMENTLQLAITSRIKLYYRPDGLSLRPELAPEKLRFFRNGTQLTLENPTPYYITVTQLNAGNRSLEGVLVPPLGKTSVKLPADAGNEITYKTINDYGAVTPAMKSVIQ